VLGPCFVEADAAKPNAVRIREVVDRERAPASDRVRGPVVPNATWRPFREGKKVRPVERLSVDPKSHGNAGVRRRGKRLVVRQAIAIAICPDSSPKNIFDEDRAASDDEDSAEDHVARVHRGFPTMMQRTARNERRTRWPPTLAKLLVPVLGNDHVSGVGPARRDEEREEALAVRMRRAVPTRPVLEPGL
jgi:hypothetical protein